MPVERGNVRDGLGVKLTLIILPVILTPTVANCVISDNSGFGVDNRSALRHDHQHHHQRQLCSPEGGGLQIGGGKLPRNLTVINSTISGNFASSDGGGIASGFSVLTIVHSNVSGGICVGDPDYGDGGGIASGYGVVLPALTITNSTWSGNSAATCGGVCRGTVEILNTFSMRMRRGISVGPSPRVDITSAAMMPTGC